MKLAEALIERKAVQTRITELRGRIADVATVQEGESPEEDPQALMAELMVRFTALEQLIARINRTNLLAVLADGTTITDALAKRDVMRLRIGALQQIAGSATTSGGYRYSRTEIKTVSTIDVAALRQETDALAQQCRALDTTIQAANWTTELL